MPSYTQYMRQMAVMDADDDNIETWITVKGNHIPIMKGQSKEDAVKAFIEKKGGSTETKTEPKPKKPMSRHAQVANLIKKDLAAKGFKASAKSSSFAGGDDVNVRVSGWYSPKIQQQIQKEYAKYQQGDVNPYEDIYEYNNIREDIPQTKYLSVDFDMPNDDDYKTAEAYYKQHWHPSDVEKFEKMTNWEKTRHLNNMFMFPRTEEHEKTLGEVKAWAQKNNMPFSYIDTMPESKSEKKEKKEKTEKEEGTPVENPTPEEVEEAITRTFEKETEKREQRIAEREKKELQENPKQVNSFSDFFNNMNAGLQPFLEMTGYEPKTTFWSDFSIAEAVGGEKAIKDTYERAFKEWKDNKEYITELVMMLNWKIWHHDSKGNDSLARLYNDLWGKADEWCMKNLKGEDLKYFLRTTD